MNYRRREKTVVVPYPYLTEDTVLAIQGIESVSTPLVAEIELNKWYTVPANATATVRAGKTIVIIRVVGDVQRIYWDCAGTTPDTVNVLAGDHILIYDGLLVPITIAGFPAFALGDQSVAVINNALIQLPANIRFVFTEST